jgi:hypothetical protein
MQSDGGAVGAGGEAGDMAFRPTRSLAAAAAQSDRRMLVRVTVEMLLRTGLRVSEFTGLRADAMVLIAPGLGCMSLPAGSARTTTYRCTPRGSPSSTATGLPTSAMAVPWQTLQIAVRQPSRQERRIGLPRVNRVESGRSRSWQVPWCVPRCRPRSTLPWSQGLRSVLARSGSR